MDVQQYVRFADTYGRAFVVGVPEVVYDSVFHFVGDKLGMTEFFAEHDCVYGESLVDVQIIFPVDCFDLFVHFIGILCNEMLDRFQDADSSSQAEICLVHHFLVSAE